jgi:hypothetical protein
MRQFIWPVKLGRSLMLFLAIDIELLTTPGNTIQLYRNTAFVGLDPLGAGRLVVALTTSA